MYTKIQVKVKKLFIYLSIFVCSLYSVTVNAQCAMCRAALTSEGNAVKAEAINDGIVYLMVIPYILVAGIGFAVYRMKKNKSS
jgi:hypothetical protein